MDPKKISNLLLQTTNGLIGTTTNFVLYTLYFTLLLPGATTPRRLYKAADDAEQMLDELNYEKIKHAVYHLTTQGLIKRLTKEGRLEITITEAGRKRLVRSLPTYRSDRPWDQHIYLISYDIPKKSNNERDKLRTYIKTTGGALLQESLWINPYNPTRLLSEFTEKNSISGSILISKLGKDGAIGEETLPNLLNRVYHFDNLQKRYDEFIKKYRLSTPSSRFAAIIEYLSILKDDPQIPFPLEPRNFSAKAAYHLFLSVSLHPNAK